MDGEEAAANENLQNSPMTPEAQPQIHEESALDSVSLNAALRILFGLNGMTLGLEGIALLYVINSRVEMPVSYLPTYGAVAFLPYSFKSLYGYLTQSKIPRHTLFMALLFGNGIFVLSTCLIPTGGIKAAFFVAFARGVTDSWAELCLGLTLVDHARMYSYQPGRNYQALASKFQAEAATSRNMGSLGAYTITFVLFVTRQLIHASNSELSSFDANVLLISSSVLQILGSLYAFVRQHELRALSHEGFEVVVDNQEGGELQLNNVSEERAGLRELDGSTTSYTSTSTGIVEASAAEVDASTPSDLQGTPWFCHTNVILVIFLQSTIMVLAMKTPISEALSHATWKTILISFLMATIFTGFVSCSGRKWYTTHGVGLYLILKHALPSESMILSSFMYSLFQSAPATIQILSLVGSAVTTTSSWCYGRWLSRYHSGNPFLAVIVGTTILSSVVSFGNIAVYRHAENGQLVWLVLFVKTITTFFGELEFLPDVVLATTSLKGSVDVQSSFLPQNIQDSADASNIGVEYGTLISCLDFGDQLGSLMTSPLVALIGITRESNFQGLDHLILTCSMIRILSLSFLPIIRKR